MNCRYLIQTASNSYQSTCCVLIIFTVSYTFSSFAFCNIETTSKQDSNPRTSATLLKSLGNPFPSTIGRKCQDVQFQGIPVLPFRLTNSRTSGCPRISEISYWISSGVVINLIYGVGDARDEGCCANSQPSNVCNLLMTIRIQAA